MRKFVGDGQGRTDSGKLRGMAITWHTGEIVENKIYGHKFRLVKLRVVDDPGLVFIPGQFVLVRMGRVDKVNDYSPCNIPEPGIIEMLIDITPADFDPPAGEGSRFIRDLQPGDKFEFAGPSGNFVYKLDGADELWFVATGSGISSLWSILRARLMAGEKRRVKLWWGLRHDADVIWEDELSELSARYPNFSFDYVLSDSTPDWGGKTGHVTEHVLKEAEGLGERKDKVAVYLCGNKGMVEGVSSGLFGLGILKERVYWEKYF